MEISFDKKRIEAHENIRQQRKNKKIGKINMNCDLEIVVSVVTQFLT